ncbi:ABC transporter permease, partial [Kitasatospora indigofera]|uniref:ABC transporter permease n=1 Tax=Kitasatospora indigofera TaxID=67307 RepID=UPI0036A28BD0
MNGPNSRPARVSGAATTAVAVARGGAKTVGPDAVVQRGSASLTARRLVRDPASMVAVAGILLIVLLAIAAPLIAQLTGHGPNEQFRDIGLTPEGLPVPPGETFLFGTDQLGRDVLVRLAYGARVSLVVGVVASLAAAMIGVLVGITAGFFGGKVDTVLSRVMDLVMSIPFLLAAIALVSVVGPSLALSTGVIVFFTWTPLARVIRGQTLALRQREFVEAARSLGAGQFSIIVRDILPNLMVPILIYTTLMVPGAIVFEATLSFLGMGVVPPTASWGGMLAEAANNSIYLVAPW